MKNGGANADDEEGIDKLPDASRGGDDEKDPSAAILTGFVVTARMKGGSLSRMLRFSACSIAIYLAAIFYLFLTVPILSSAKATYTLGLIPCFALVGTAGFEVLMRRRFVRAAVHGLFACWAVGSFASYFVI